MTSSPKEKCDLETALKTAELRTAYRVLFPIKELDRFLRDGME
jgi:hypothetical protein